MDHRDDDYDGEYEVTIFNVFAVMATCLSVGDVPKWYWVFRERISEANKGDVNNYIFKIVEDCTKEGSHRVLSFEYLTESCVFLGHAVFSMIYSPCFFFYDILSVGNWTLSSCMR